MNTYAVLETGGKQYRVRPGDAIEVERLPGEVGEEITLDNVLAIGGETELRVGTPRIEEARVVCEVAAFKRGPKLVNFKKKRRKGYHRKVGHRQDLMVLNVKSVG